MTFFLMRVVRMSYLLFHTNFYKIKMYDEKHIYLNPDGYNCFSGQSIHEEGYYCVSTCFLELAEKLCFRSNIRCCFVLLSIFVSGKYSSHSRLFIYLVSC